MSLVDADLTFQDALEAVGVLRHAPTPTRPRSYDLVIGDVMIQIESAAVVRPGWVRALPTLPETVAGVVVSDQISAESRGLLDDAGWSWLDRRGHLKFHYQKVWIDTGVPPTPRLRARREPLNGSVAMGAALGALLDPARGLGGIRETARLLSAAPASVSVAVRRLVDAGLLTRDHRAIVPDLFWALAERWPPPSIGLAVRPMRAHEGLVVVGTRAAAARGAPVSHTADYPLELLAADPTVVRRLVREVGEVPLERAPVRMALAPSALAAWPGDPTLASLPLAASVIVALSLAIDPARGAEVLDGWEDPHRVW